MSQIIEVQRKIRRAVQIPLYNAAVSAGLVNDANEPLIQWGGAAFAHYDTDGAPIPAYLAVEVGFGDVVVHEIGGNPMVEGNGRVTINIHTPMPLGEDGNDALLGIIAAAYPYGSEATFEGLTVNIDKTDPRGYGSDGPWKTGLYSVHWNIYRRSS
jgi:hypothetical protein